VSIYSTFLTLAWTDESTLQAQKVTCRRTMGMITLVIASQKPNFRNTPAADRVQAKTGFFTGAVALSGYITPKAHPPLVFSILPNHAIGSLSEQQKAIAIATGSN
jgi:D-Ala-D-Ala carboxypeptidase 3 (S13) family